MCGTPVQTIWDRDGRGGGGGGGGGGGQGRPKSAPDWPEFGFGAVQRFPNGPMIPEMDPK